MHPPGISLAECPETGTVEQGQMIEQAIAGLKEATRLCLEEFSALLNGAMILQNSEQGFKAFSHQFLSRISNA